MKAWKHLNFEQRKIIVHLLAKHHKLCVIADTIAIDPSAVSKEVRRNRILSMPGKVADQGCKHLVCFPYCCNGCVKKYQGCLHNHYTYDAQKAQGLAQRRLVDTRSGINMTQQNTSSWMQPSSRALMTVSRSIISYTFIPNCLSPFLPSTV